MKINVLNTRISKIFYGHFNVVEMFFEQYTYLTCFLYINCLGQTFFENIKRTLF